MNQFKKNLQGDIIRIGTKKIFINPFLYFRRLDANTKSWLKEINQFSEAYIFENRFRFYPDLDWQSINKEKQLVIKSTIELFLKTLEIIKTFHPDLSIEQLIIVESYLVSLKKIHFEKWVRRKLKINDNLRLKEQRKLERATFITNWQKWLSLKQTQKIFIPFFVIILLSALAGWFAGVSRNSCNPYFERISFNQF